MLIGRESEQSVIARLLAGARLGHSGVLLIVGEAGIGKTALLDHAAGLTDGTRVLRAAGTEPEKEVAFAGLHQLLRPALGGLDDIPAPQADALGVALALRSGPAGDRFAVGAATLTLLSRLAEERPLLLLVDDAHALDRPSAETLSFVARRLMADRIAMLVTTRREDGPLSDSGAPCLRLSGLMPGAIAALLSARGRPAVDEELAVRLHRATGGNPLAVVEMADDGLDRLSPELPVPAPDRLTRTFTRRIAGLGRAARAALLLAAVADGDLAVVSRAAAGLDTTAADLAEAETSDLVRVSAGRLEFRHPLVRSSAYAAASPALRRRAHRAVAAALPETDLERRAWNLCEATVGVDDDVAASIERVGQEALDRSASSVAATAFERAALLSSVDRTRAERFLAAGEAAWLAGQAERAETLLQQASALTTDPPLLAAIDGLRGNIALRAGSLDQARDLLRGAADRLTVIDPDSAVMLRADVVTACFYLGDATSAVEATTGLDDLVGRSRTDLARIRGAMTVGMAQVLAGGKGIDRIRGAVEDLVSLPGWADDSQRPGWMVLGPLFLRESETGREVVRHAVEEVRGRTALGALPHLLFHTARHDATTARWESALTCYEEAIQLARETGQTTDLAMCLAGLAWLRSRTGAADDCRAKADEATGLARRHHINLAAAWAAFARGELELAQGDSAAAAAHLEELDLLLDRIGLLDVDLSPGPELTEALLRTGRRTEACDTAWRYHERAVAKGQPWAIARAERALAIAEVDEDPAAHFERALRWHPASPDTYEEGRTHLAYGASLRRGRHRVAARPQLRAALEVFDRLGAHPWADIAAAELEATGETAHRRGDSSIDLLTPQELQIARMLGAGRTTREAAAALFLSPKTVEYHLRHVYTKLAVRSRAELTAALQEGP